MAQGQMLKDGESPEVVADRRDSHIGSPSKDAPSSPEIEIEIEIGEPEDLEDDLPPAEIQIDGIEDDMVFTILSQFPYGPDGAFVDGAKLYLDHLDNGMCTRSRSAKKNGPLTVWQIPSTSGR